MEDLELDYEFDDIVCQRAKALCLVAQAVDLVSDPEAKAQLLTMMKKVNLSVVLPSTAELSVLPGGKPEEQPEVGPFKNITKI